MYGLTGRLIGLLVLALALRVQSVPVASGVVRDDAGKPIAGVRVTATSAAAGPFATPPMVSAPTDAEGWFSFASLPPGNYSFSAAVTSVAAPMPSETTRIIRVPTLAADRESRVFVWFSAPVVATTGTIDTLYQPAFHGGASPQPISVDAARPRADLVIVLIRKPVVRLAGTVTAPLPVGAIDSERFRLIVRLLPAGTPAAPARGALYTETPIATTVADVDGRFVFPAVAAGDYLVEAHRAFPGPTADVNNMGVPLIDVSGRNDGDPQGLAFAQAMSFTSDRADLDITLRPSGAASRAALEIRNARNSVGGAPMRQGGLGAGAGRGAMSGRGVGGVGAISGRLTDADGQPLANAQVFALIEARDDLATIASPAITTADGTYRIGGLGPGRYYVMVPSVIRGANLLEQVSNAFPPSETVGAETIGYVTTFYPAASTTAAATAVVTTPGELKDIDIVLQRQRVHNVGGRVSAATSMRELITLLPADRRMRIGGANVRRTAVSAEGTFAFVNVPGGDYLINHSSMRGWVRQALTVPLEAPLNLALKPFVSVSGRVVVEAGDDPAAPLPPKLNVEVRPSPLEIGDGFSPAAVRPDGAFDAMRVIPGRTYDVRVTVQPPWRVVSVSLPGVNAVGTTYEIANSVSGAIITITNR